jgi:uncharacterized protein
MTKTLESRQFEYAGRRFAYNPATMLAEVWGDTGPRSFQDPIIQEPVFSIGRRRGVNFITLNVAHDCNMACPYCFAKQGMYGGPRQLMSGAVAYKAVDWLLDSAGDQRHVYLRFLGGEPLLNIPTIESTIDYAKGRAAEAGKEVHFSINTNGTIFNDKIERLLRENAMTISVSIDGDKEAHDAYRVFRNGRGTFDVAMKTLPRLIECDPLTMVNATVTSAALDLYRYAMLYRENGVRLVRFAMVGTSEKNMCVTTPEQVRRLTGQYDLLARRYLDDLRAGDYWYLSDFYKYLDNLQYRQARVSRCGAGTSYVNIDVNGAIHLCHRFTADKSQQVGTVHEKGIGELKPAAGRTFAGEDAWVTSIDHRRLDGELLGHDGRNAGVCTQCDIHSLCGGYCFHDSAMLFGSTQHGPDVAKCEVDRHLAKVAMWLLSELHDRDDQALDAIRDLHVHSIQHVKGD